MDQSRPNWWKARQFADESGRLPSLPDYVRNTGRDYEVERRITYPSLELPALVKEADLIVLGVFEAPRPRTGQC